MSKPTTQFGGLSGKQMAVIAGVPETRVNQAWEHALDMSAIFLGASEIAFFRAHADRLENPTRGMLEILERRQRKLKDDHRRKQPRRVITTAAVSNRPVRLDNRPVGLDNNPCPS